MAAGVSHHPLPLPLGGETLADTFHMQFHYQYVKQLYYGFIFATNELVAP